MRAKSTAIASLLALRSFEVLSLLMLVWSDAHESIRVPTLTVEVALFLLSSFGSFEP